MGDEDYGYNANEGGIPYTQVPETFDNEWTFDNNEGGAPYTSPSPYEQVSGGEDVAAFTPGDAGFKTEGEKIAAAGGGATGSALATGNVGFSKSASGTAPATSAPAYRSSAVSGDSLAPQTGIPTSAYRSSAVSGGSLAPQTGIPTSAGGAREAAASGASNSAPTMWFNPNVPVKPTAPGAVKPTAPGAGTYEAPAYDERKVAALTQKAANPYIADLHRTILEAIAQSRGESNPTVQRYVNEGIINKAGGEIGKVMGEAGKEGIAEYQPQYNAAVDAAKTTFDVEEKAKQNEYTQAMNVYERALSQYLAGYSGVMPAGGSAIPRI